MKYKRLAAVVLTVCFSLIPFLLTADITPGAPAAKRILFIRDSAVNFPMVVTELRNNAASCTFPTGPSNIVDTFDCPNDDSLWPASFAGYDEVWDARWNFTGGGCTYSLNASRIADLQGVMAAGGGVFLLSENNPWFKSGVREFVNSVTAGGYDTSGPYTGPADEYDVLNPAAAALAENFHTDFINLAACGTANLHTSYPGGVLLTQLAGGYPVIVDPSALHAIGVAFVPAALNAPYNNGKLFVWYDKQAFQENASCGDMSMCLVKNIMDFLVAAVTTPTITPTPAPNTPTATLTFTKTITPTSTNPPTSTYTPTITITSTPTATPSITTTSTPPPSATITPTSTPTEPPFSLELITNYPNPTSDFTWIVYELTRASLVTVVIYTISGERVVELKQDGYIGRNKIYWNGNNRTGLDASTGVYIYSIEAVSGSDKKLIMSRLSVVK